MKSNKHHHYTISFEKKQRGKESIFQFLLSIIWRENFVFDLHTARCPQKIAVSVVEQQSDRAGAAGARVEGENLRMQRFCQLLGAPFHWVAEKRAQPLVAVQ